jgi:hypothetical protein
MIDAVMTPIIGPDYWFIDKNESFPAYPNFPSIYILFNISIKFVNFNFHLKLSLINFFAKDVHSLRYGASTEDESAGYS